MGRPKPRARNVAPIVTDHALLEWLERHHKVEIECFRRMLHGEVAGAIEAGAVSVKRDGLLYIFMEGHLVTVRPA